ncbi:MAG: pseudouridine synthase, partial [Rhodanobacteraceae bacterium]
AKTYRVQVRAVLDEVTLGKLRAGIVDREERLTAESIRMIGGGARNTWCEIVLREGRNRQIRRMLSACGCDVLRLIRIAIGPLQLGDLPKGGWRELTEVEMRDLSDVAS